MYSPYLLWVYSIGFIFTLVVVNCAVIPSRRRLKLAPDPCTTIPSIPLSTLSFEVFNSMTYSPSWKLAWPGNSSDWTTWSLNLSGMTCQSETEVSIIVTSS